jgi:hypothetical protein
MNASTAAPSSRKNARTSRATGVDAPRNTRRRALTNGARVVRLGITVVATAAIAILGGATSVFACPVCFGAEETSMIDGTKLGVMVMVAVTVTVQGAFVGFFLYLRKRAKRNAEMELDSEWVELQRANN